jgi:hypothetical protein
MMVGDTAERVSSRKLDPFPKVLVCAVLSESFGLGLVDLEGEEGCCCERSAGAMIREVVILCDESW